METWTKQKGYPFIYVKSKDRTLEFEQSQFLSSGLHGDGQWIVPITLSLGSYSNCKEFLLETKIRRLDESELCQLYDGSSSSRGKNEENFDKSSWVKVNVGQIGFYRVKYDDKLGAQLRKAVKENCLSAADKLGILDDIYALCEACEVSLSSLLSLMNVYGKELEYIVLSRLINICYAIAKISSEAVPDSVDDLKQFFTKLILFSAEKLGWEPIAGESHLSALLREEVLIALATFGHTETHQESVKRFQSYLNDSDTSFIWHQKSRT